MFNYRLHSNYKFWSRYLSASACLLALNAQAQQADTTTEGDENVILMSPFEVQESEQVGYLATTTLAGTRLKTELRDVGSAISVVTKEFLDDTGATSNDTLLTYTTGTETGGTFGNFGGGSADGAEEANFRSPHTNNRVRGLDSADNTRNFFLTDIPWDSYNVDRVDIQRGPNAILFGIGSPAGIINANVEGADFLDNRGEVEARYGSFGTHRASFNYNHILLEDQLAVRVAGLYDAEKFRQDDAYETDRRGYIALRYTPDFLATDNMKTTLKFSFERGNIKSNRPRVRPPEDQITPFFNPDTAGVDPKQTYSIVGAWTPDGVLNSGSADYNPQIDQIFGPSIAFFDDVNSGSATYVSFPETQMSDNFSINSNGELVGGEIDGISFHRPVGIIGFRDYALRAGLPFASSLLP